MSISRRQVILFGGLGVLGAGALTVPTRSVEAKVASALDPSQMPVPFRAQFLRTPVLAPYATGYDPEDEMKINYYSITQSVGNASMLPNRNLLTPILGYNGTFPGPTLKMDRWTKSVVRVRNQLPATHPTMGHNLYTSTHLHGSASLPQFDGYASDIAMPGFYKDYKYPNNQHARTLWYHDHAVHYTAPNVYSGLAGQYHVHDPLERQLLPQGQFDVALTLSDAMFAADGSLGYDDDSHSGLWGDVIMANGRPWPVMQVQRRIYRFRILNASISRSFRPYLSTGDPVTVVATDGGLMPYAQSVYEWRHGSAERYEVLIDFRHYQPGQRVELRNLSNKNNVDYDFTHKMMAFDVTDEPVDTSDPTWNTIPVELNPSNEVMTLKESDATKFRSFRLKRDDITNLWSIDDMNWAEVIASNYRKVIADPELDAVEIWEFDNRSGGWFHPVHIHLLDFKIIGGEDRADFSYEQGPKDVVYCGEGEKVRLLMKFGPHRGRYMIHCHNLPHEDHDMMVQFSVGMAPEDFELDVNDPINAAKPGWDDGVYPPELPPAPTFSDVNEDTVFAKEITWIAAVGITTGYPDGSYKPLYQVNRDMMAAFLYRLAGKPDHQPTQKFKDVSPGHVFFKEISWLATQKITTGWPDGTFRPYQPINRDQMAAFLYRFAGSPVVEKFSDFKDVKPGMPFYKEISWLADTGVTEGWEDNTFRPLQPVYRDTMAAFLHRFAKRVLRDSDD
ncbi:FtsP/CotA-like multicopper oxidase with cupredoxin domain [Arthrobacter pigmenti]|uniref:FtsP/CotA-like multicopper oxidase with cupredoxin domain n=1 Tax=Arthrobacter pigmenti TaxID=271432 RepID=A0A846RX01_9MICC|nr:S-layer homology domain-containing protein [Arthrobacter pigmenti]NJC22741.1 FtsP/CotA-like multicopper oxidase with cupredoxin domain [Arthrobacter pigmenti]